MPTPIRPLSDIRVLDFTNLPPGSSAAVMLADLGADVVRVEPPKGKGKPMPKGNGKPMPKGKAKAKPGKKPFPPKNSK